MTTQQAIDEFVNLRNDDAVFAEHYGENEFCEWISENDIELDDDGKLT